jgi:hypothetical protein
MTMNFADGCDLYGATSDLNKASWNIADSPNVTVLTNGGRFSNGSVAIRGSAASIYRATEVANSTIFVQLAFKLESLVHATDEIMLKLFNNSGADTICSIAISQVGEIKAYDSSDSLVATSAAAVIREGVWQYLELKVLIDNSGTITVKISGSQVINATGVDTKPGAGEDVDRVQIYSASDAAGFGIIIDDIIFFDDAGSINNDFLGDVTIDTLLPNSDDATDAAWASFPAQGTGDDHLNIDDPIPGSDDGDSTYNFSKTVSADSLYGFDDLAETPQYIYGVQLALSAKKSDAGSRSVAPLFKNDTKIAGVTFNPGTDYEINRQIREQSADASPVDWTKAKVDALLAGMRLVS